MDMKASKRSIRHGSTKFWPQFSKKAPTKHGGDLSASLSPSAHINRPPIISKQLQFYKVDSASVLPFTPRWPYHQPNFKTSSEASWHCDDQSSRKDFSSERYSTHSSEGINSPTLVSDHPFLSYLSSYPSLAATTYQLLSWDTSLCIHINRYANYQRIASVFKSVSRLGDGWFWAAMLMMAVIIEVASGKVGADLWLPLATVIITSAMGVGLYKVLKVKTVRPRPYQVHQVIIMGERPLDVFSFPSGHTLQAVLFTCALGGYYPALLWLMVPFAILVALSRMILGLHYPTDVAVGGMIGAALAQLSPIIYNLLRSVVA